MGRCRQPAAFWLLSQRSFHAFTQEFDFEAGADGGADLEAGMILDPQPAAPNALDEPVDVAAPEEQESEEQKQPSDLPPLKRRRVHRSKPQIVDSKLSLSREEIEANRLNYSKKVTDGLHSVIELCADDWLADSAAVADPDGDKGGRCCERSG